MSFSQLSPLLTIPITYLVFAFLYYDLWWLDHASVSARFVFVCVIGIQVGIAWQKITSKKKEK